MESGKLTFGELRKYLGEFGFIRRLYDVDTNECQVYDRSDWEIPESYNEKFVVNIKLGDKDPNLEYVEALDASSVDIYLSDNPKESVENKMPDYKSGELKFGELRNYFDSSVRLAMWFTVSGKESDDEYELFGSKAVVPDTYNEKYVAGFSKHMETFRLADVPERIAEKKEKYKDESEEELLKGPAFADCIEVLMSDCPRDEYFKKANETEGSEEE